MSMHPDQVAAIARLARLALRDEDVPAVAGKLSAILGLVERMNAVDTDGIEPMAHPLDLSQRLRADRVSESDRRDEFQAIAPQTADGLYLVPRVIE